MSTFFSSSVKFFATCETPDVVLRYTSTGVEPTMSSPRFPETGIEVKSNKTYRIKAFSADKLESNTLVKTFFVDIRKTDLPIVNISMNPQFLTDDYIGIYIKEIGRAHV